MRPPAGHQLRIRRLLPFAGLVLLAGSGRPGANRAAAHLAVRTPQGWVTIWRADHAPARWPGADAALDRVVVWHPGRTGVAWSELELDGVGEAWRTRLVVARIDPAQVRLTLANGVAPGGLLPVWKAEHADDAVSLALNAGQFSGAAPWGWVVHDGVEYRAPGRGPLAVAVIIEPDGAVTFADDADVGRLRAGGAPQRPSGVLDAFQSYPALLTGDGDVPRLLREPGPDIDLGHRDARLALGQRADGSLIVALTRFDALGPGLGGIPFGLTVPEMAAVMGSLGCRRAVALDGGVSAQLLVQDARGGRHLWRGLRPVPLGLLVHDR